MSDKLSLRQRLLNYLRSKYPEAIAKGDLDRIVMANTKYIPENCGRRLRELVEDEELEVEYRNKNHAFYKAKAPLRIEQTWIMFPEGKRLVEKKIFL